eukprot:gene7381-505_t
MRAWSAPARSWSPLRRPRARSGPLYIFDPKLAPSTGSDGKVQVEFQYPAKPTQRRKIVAGGPLTKANARHRASTPASCPDTLLCKRLNCLPFCAMESRIHLRAKGGSEVTAHQAKPLHGHAVLGPPPRVTLPSLLTTLAPSLSTASSQVTCHARDMGGRGGAPLKGGGRHHKGPKVKKEKVPVVDISRKKGCCYGCGTALQSEYNQGAGYVQLAKFEAKKLHKQLDKLLCERCADLCNGAMIPAVQDFNQKLRLLKWQQKGTAEHDAAAADVKDAQIELLGKALISPEELRKQLLEVRDKKSLVVMVVDLLDASGSLMPRVRDMVGKNPIVLVGTKMDLLPDGFHPRDMTEWLTESAMRKRVNVVSSHLVSSYSGEERKGRDVYVIGAANVGKSAFVRAMLREMGKFDGDNYDPAAMSNGRYLPVESAMPGTTLGIIPLQAFVSGGTLFDTPGVHLHHRVPHMLAPDELRLMHPHKKLAAFVAPTPKELTEPEEAEEEDEDEQGVGLAGVSRGLGGGPSSQATPILGTKMVTNADGSVTMNVTPEDGLNWEAKFAGLPLDAKRVKETRKAKALQAPDAKRVKEKRKAKALQAPDAKRVKEKRKAKALQAPDAKRVKESRKAKGLQVPVSATYVWADLVRLDLVAVPPTTSVVFYGPTSMKVFSMPLLKASQKFEIDAEEEQEERKASGSKAKMLICTESVESRGGLVPHDFMVSADGTANAIADIAISGLPGWVTLWAPATKSSLRVRVWAPRGVEVFLRPSLPIAAPFKVGKAWSGNTDDADDDDEDSGDVMAGLSAAPFKVRHTWSGNDGDDDDANSGNVMAGLTDEELSMLADDSYGTSISPINQSGWWESAKAEMDSAHEAAIKLNQMMRKQGLLDAAKLDDEEFEDEDGDEDDEEPVIISRRPLRSGLRGRAGRGARPPGRAVPEFAMSGTVEDILRRPRLEEAFDQLEEALGSPQDARDEEEDDEEDRPRREESEGLWGLYFLSVTPGPSN